LIEPSSPVFPLSPRVLDNSHFSLQPEAKL
jgi:hypothetical protein